MDRKNVKKSPHRLENHEAYKSVVQTDQVSLPEQLHKRKYPFNDLENSMIDISDRRFRDFTRDMEALKLSRQDDPFLQNLASRESKPEEEQVDEGTSLLGKDKKSSHLHDTLTLLDIHEHMIRSPPPTTLPVREKQIFQFPSMDGRKNDKSN